MALTGQNASMYRGNRKVLGYTLTDLDNSGAALDITAYRLQWAATRTNASGQPIESAAVIDLNTDDHPAQVVKTDAANGVMQVVLLEADTINLTPGEYYIELEGVDGSGNSEVFATGTLTLEPNVENA